MSGFVDECRKEWDRLGVPDAVSNEMAADLAADLAEAEAEGASAEDVLGNAVFDAKSFAASWATARGVVSQAPVPEGRSRTPWVVVVCNLVSFVAGAVGFVLITSGRGMAVASAVRGSFGLRIPRSFGPPSLWVGPHAPGSPIFLHSAGFQALGAILLMGGVIGLCLTLWLWSPWSTPPTRTPLRGPCGAAQLSLTRATVCSQDQGPQTGGEPVVERMGDTFGRVSCELVSRSVRRGVDPVWRPDLHTVQVLVEDATRGEECPVVDDAHRSRELDCDRPDQMVVDDPSPRLVLRKRRLAEAGAARHGRHRGENEMCSVGRCDPDRRADL